MSYDNANHGILFKNDYKLDDTEPDYKGDMQVGGEEFKIYAYIKTAKNGRKFLSIQVRKEEK